MGKSDEAAASRDEEAMQLAAAKQEYAEHMDSLRAEVKSIPCNLLPNLSLSVDHRHRFRGSLLCCWPLFVCFLDLFLV
jgi:hypothetical protein